MITRIIAEIIIVAAISFLTQTNAGADVVMAEKRSVNVGVVAVPTQKPERLQLSDNQAVPKTLTPSPGSPALQSGDDEPFAMLEPSQDELEALFAKYAEKYNVNRQTLKKIASCESHFNSKAVNGPYGGIYQFLATTWSASRQKMGLDPNPDLRFNTEEAVKTAAYKIARDGTGAWPVCGR